MSSNRIAKSVPAAENHGAAIATHAGQALETQATGAQAELTQVAAATQQLQLAVAQKLHQLLSPEAFASGVMTQLHALNQTAGARPAYAPMFGGLTVDVRSIEQTASSLGPTISDFLVLVPGAGDTAVPARQITGGTE